MSHYYQYKNQSYRCGKCGWEGLGEQTEDGFDSGSDWFSIACPQCDNILDVITYPTIKEILEYGSEEEKAHASKQQQFIDRVMKSRLKSTDQLPDIEADRITISLHEEKAKTGDDSYIVLYWNGKELWREIRTYEYYDRYLELGAMLKEKYGERLVDFEAEHTTYLGGDCSFAFDEVREFSESLKTKSNK